MQVTQTREGIDQFISEPFTEILLVPIRTHIHERQDCNRGSIRYSQAIDSEPPPPDCPSPPAQETTSLKASLGHPIMRSTPMLLGAYVIPV